MNEIISIIGLAASLVTLFAVWGNISSIYFNWKTFRKGGIRTTFMSGAYTIQKGDLDGQQIYQSSDNPKDYIRYREIGKIEHIEDIPPFLKWNKSHWSDDIRTPNYPIRLLRSSHRDK